MNTMNLISFLLVVSINVLTVCSWKLAWLPGYAPPPVGDRFNDHYGLLKREPFQHQIGMQLLNDDGTRFAPDAHPWEDDGVWVGFEKFGAPRNGICSNSHTHGWCGSNFVLNYMRSIVVGNSFSKKTLEGAFNDTIVNDLWEGEWCHNNHKKSNLPPAYNRYILEGNNYITEECSKNIMKSGLHSLLQNGIAIFEGILFKTLINNDRRYVEFSMKQGQQIYKEINVLLKTPYFKTLDESYRPFKIDFTGSDAKLTCNNPSKLQMTLQNEGLQTIGESQYSSMEAVIAISYTNKTFSERYENLYMEESKATMAAPGLTKLWNNDEALHVKFVDGVARVDLQIQDVYSRVDLNVTVKRDTYNYKPIMESDVTISRTYLDNQLFTYKYEQIYDDATNIFQVDVQKQVPYVLRLVPGYKIDKYQTINFPLEPPLKVELVDSKGYRITSGEYANLTVEASDNKFIELSREKTFQLNRGIGTYRGSIVEKSLNAEIQFFTRLPTGDKLLTNKTDRFDVTSNHIGIIHDNSRGEDLYKFTSYRDSGFMEYLRAVRGEDTENALFFPQTGTSPGGFGVIFGELKQQGVGNATELRNIIENHRPMYKYVVPSPISGKKEQEYWNSTSTFEQTAKIKYIALIGSDNSNTESYAATAASHGLVTISDASTNDKFRDKKKYPLLVRLAFSEEYRFTLVSNFLKSRNWEYVVIVTGRRQTLPASLAEKLIHFNVKYYNVIFPSEVHSDGTLGVPSAFDLENFFKQIEQSDIKIIMTLLEGQELDNMVQSCVDRKFNNAGDYTWIADGDMLAKDGPLRRIKETSELKKVLASFDKALAFDSYYEDFNLEHDAFKRVNPTGLDWLQSDKRNDYFMMYDAAAIIRDAVLRAQIEKITITPESLLGLIRQFGQKTSVRNLDVSVEDQIEKNILGDGITFDDNFDRSNYSAILKQIDSSDPADFIKNKRLIILGQNVTVQDVSPENKLEEIVYDGLDLEYSSSNHFTEIKINSTDLQIIGGSFKPQSVVVGKPTRTETPPLSFYCDSGCGGARLNTTHWSNGQCSWNLGSGCKCKQGYSESSNCSQPICQGCELHQGTCVKTDTCECNTGYKHSNDSIKDCAVFHCFTGGRNCSANGACTAGDQCTCDPLYWGKKCEHKCKCQNEGKCDDSHLGTGTCDCTGTGYGGSECQTHTLTVAVLVAFSVLLVVAVSVYLIRRYLRKVIAKQALMSMDWRAGWEDIRIKQANQKSSMKSMMSMMSMMSAKSLTTTTTKTFCQNQGQWNGREIVVKMIRKDDLELTHPLREEIKMVRELHHPNLCLFIGACLEAPHICILNEVCGKGSLEDLLANDEVSLGWDFRYSMLKDICRGMTYLGNSELGSHGRLKSSNCLVDNRWCVKISDYGLKTFKSDQYGVREFSLESGVGAHIPGNSELASCDYYNLLWTAPEIVATGVSHPNHVGYGTPKGDIYSFAIIITEVCTRMHPYHELSHLRPDEIVQMVGRLIELCKNVKPVECRDIDGIPIHVIRPQINDDDFPENIDQAEALATLIEVCWNEDPKCRPDFATCMKCLNRISPHRGELMDNLIILMEQYTSSLEAIVAERTANIQEEKQKSDLLLSKMLPPLIAEELKSGRNPQPEYFNNVTIYFSDVVGFGQLCSQSTPFEVVEILNGIYSVMDNVIDSFDCYKVETIADCYVVASGLPTRNGDRHAGEIASMALELLQAFNGVSYVGHEKKQIQLRVGMHSGPIVAGVVGIKMPRYCLFGDTMNTASRMESGGFALKIHLSEDTYKVLEKLGGYICDCRGEIPVKGRGTMTTYWLKGKEGIEYNLPSEDLALSASQHYFK